MLVICIGKVVFVGNGTLKNCILLGLFDSVGSNILRVEFRIYSRLSYLCRTWCGQVYIDTGALLYTGLGSNKSKTDPYDDCTECIDAQQNAWSIHKNRIE